MIDRSSLGILILAKRRGHISTVRPLLDGLVANGIRLSMKLVEATIREANE
jgi:predicted nucleic acid-binding protein